MNFKEKKQRRSLENKTKKLNIKTFQKVKMARKICTHHFLFYFLKISKGKPLNLLHISKKKVNCKYNS